MPDTATVELVDDYTEAKAQCTRLSEALRTYDPETSETTEADLKAQLVAAILKLKALRKRLGLRGLTRPTATIMGDR